MPACDSYANLTLATATTTTTTTGRQPRLQLTTPDAFPSSDGIEQCDRRQTAAVKRCRCLPASLPYSYATPPSLLAWLMVASVCFLCVFLALFVAVVPVSVLFPFPFVFQGRALLFACFSLLQITQRKTTESTQANELPTIPIQSIYIYVLLKYRFTVLVKPKWQSVFQNDKAKHIKNS